MVRTDLIASGVRMELPKSTRPNGCGELSMYTTLRIREDLKNYFWLQILLRYQHSGRPDSLRYFDRELVHSIFYGNLSTMISTPNLILGLSGWLYVLIGLVSVISVL